jgi:hypothetical protein
MRWICQAVSGFEVGGHLSADRRRLASVLPPPELYPHTSRHAQHAAWSNLAPSLIAGTASSLAWAVLKSSNQPLMDLIGLLFGQPFR